MISICQRFLCEQNAKRFNRDVGLVTYLGIRRMVPMLYNINNNEIETTRVGEKLFSILHRVLSPESADS